MRERKKVTPKLGLLMVDVKQAAAMCSVGVSTFWKLAKTKEDFPKPIYFNARCARFKVADIERWVKSLNSTSPAQ